MGFLEPPPPCHKILIRGKIAWREMCPPFHATGVKFHAAGGKWREISRHWREIIKISRQSKFF